MDDDLADDDDEAFIDELFRSATIALTEARVFEDEPDAAIRAYLHRAYAARLSIGEVIDAFRLDPGIARLAGYAEEQMPALLAAFDRLNNEVAREYYG